MVHFILSSHLLGLNVDLIRFRCKNQPVSKMRSFWLSRTEAVVTRKDNVSLKITLSLKLSRKIVKLPWIMTHNLLNRIFSVPVKTSSRSLPTIYIYRRVAGYVPSYPFSMLAKCKTQLAKFLYKQPGETGCFL